MKYVDKHLSAIRETRDIKSLPQNYISELESELSDFYIQIKNFSSADDADEILISLGEFQAKLCELSFRFNVPLSKKLNMLVRDFDRSDIIEERRYFFKKINNYLCSS